MRRMAIVVAVGVVASVLALVAGSSPASAAACEKTWANTGASGVWDQLGVANAGEPVVHIGSAEHDERFTPGELLKLSG